MQRPFKLDPQRERSYEFSVSRIVRRIFFFWECSLRFFLFFAYIYEILQHGTKNDLNRFFLKNLGFLKIRKTFQKWGFLEFSQKKALGIFLIFGRNVELNSAFQPAKIFCEKKFCSEVISGQRCTRLITEWSSTLHFISYWKRMDLAETFKNDPLMVLRRIMVCSTVLSKNCLSLPNILWLNDPFPIIWFLALKWWDLGITFKKWSFMVHFHCSWMNYSQFKQSWPKLVYA